jgi:uncharacterized protein YndB with AHSA1/START domain
MNAPFVDSLTVQRTFKAPRSKVFNAWKDPELVKLWLGGQQARKLHAEIDFRVGGAYRVEIQNPSGATYHLHGTYQEIDEPERIVFTWAFDTWDSAQDVTLVTVTFSEAEGQTNLTLTHERFRDVPTRDLHGEGWGVCFDRLENLL